MRVFGREAAEIIPHTSDNAFNLDSESPGKARLMLRRACLVTGRRGPMPRASAPPKADAQSSGKTLNMPNKNAAPQASRRSVILGVLAERLGAGGLALGINCAIQAGIRFGAAG